MAEIQKRSRPRTNPLGAPPTPEETRGNLMEPEVAPAPVAASLQAVPKPAPAESVQPEIQEEPKEAVRTKRRPSREDSIDGRSLRRTGRTEQFSTRVHPDFKKRLYKLAKQTGKNYNVILEESLDLYLTRMEQGGVA